MVKTRQTVPEVTHVSTGANNTPVDTNVTTPLLQASNMAEDSMLTNLENVTEIVKTELERVPSVMQRQGTPSPSASGSYVMPRGPDETDDGDDPHPRNPVRHSAGDGVPFVMPRHSTRYPSSMLRGNIVEPRLPDEDDESRSRNPVEYSVGDGVPSVMPSLGAPKEVPFVKLIPP